MPFISDHVGHPARNELNYLSALVSAQNRTFAEVRNAAIRLKRTDSARDREEYLRLSEQARRTQIARETLRNQALAAGASPKLVRKQERYAERSFTFHY